MIAADIVVPGDPDKSRMWNRVAVRADMPFNGAAAHRARDPGPPGLDGQPEPPGAEAPHPRAAAGPHRRRPGEGARPGQRPPLHQLRPLRRRAPLAGGDAGGRAGAGRGHQLAVAPGADRQAGAGRPRPEHLPLPAVAAGLGPGRLGPDDGVLPLLPALGSGGGAGGLRPTRDRIAHDPRRLVPGDGHQAAAVPRAAGPARHAGRAGGRPQHQHRGQRQPAAPADRRPHRLPQLGRVGSSTG